MNTARFLMYVWPFFKIMYERVKYVQQIQQVKKELNKFTGLIQVLISL